MAIAAMTIIGCQEKEIETYEPIPNEGSTFELFADIVQTKTTLNGYYVEWDADDVLYMVTPGKDAWSTAQSFTYADGKFVTESTLSEGEYTINAIYCTESQSVYHKNGGTTHNLSAVQSQSGATTDHIQNYDALVGTFNVNVPMSEPAVVEMAHLYTMMEVNVNNNTGEEIEIAQFEMTATDANLAGIFTVTAFDEPSVELKSSASETITVSVSGEATVADKKSFPVYFVMAPLEEYSGKITFKVSTTDGKTYTKTMTVDEGKKLNFAAGRYNRTGYTIETADENAQSLPWSEDFSGDISQYTLIDSEVNNNNYAGGESPELMIKSQGYMVARISTSDYSGDMLLTFKSNHADYLDVVVSSGDISVSEVENTDGTEYIINVPETITDFALTIKNTSGDNARLDDILLVKGVPAKQELVFEQSSVSYTTINYEEFEGQSVSGAKTDITYSSNNTTVAQINFSTGKVTLTGTTGVAEITATAVATEEYRMATATYTITVVDASYSYVLVDSNNPINVGDEIVIVAKDYDYALSTTQNKNNRGQATVTKGATTVTFGDDVQLLQVELGNIDETFALNTGNGYLYAASSSNNYLKTETTLSNNSSWLITIAEDGTATLQAQGSYTRNVMQYNSSSSLFACYSSASQKALSIYKKTPAAM